MATCSTCAQRYMHGACHAWFVQHKLRLRMAAVQTRDAVNRLLTYRWYPTVQVNYDGRLLVSSGVDLDQNTGCAHARLTLAGAHTYCSLKLPSARQSSRQCAHSAELEVPKRKLAAQPAWCRGAGRTEIPMRYGHAGRPPSRAWPIRRCQLTWTPRHPALVAGPTTGRARSTRTGTSCPPTRPLLCLTSALCLANLHLLLRLSAGRRARLLTMRAP